MGVYLIGIMYKEMITRNEYYKHDWEWRRGPVCKSLGAISVISSEVSVFTLVFIAYDRFLYVVHGLEYKKLSYRTAVSLLVITWLASSVLAILPTLKEVAYFYENGMESFYGSDGICMPLQLGTHSTAWQYCIAIFGVINLIAALCLIFLYIRIFYSFYKTAQESTNVTDDHRTMAKRFAVIVLTDVCCWVPVALLLFLSLRSHSDNENLYAWFSICVIPINSAINPLLYTFGAPTFWNSVTKWFTKHFRSCRKGWFKINTDG
ncbi:partial [Paramuricea clavata]|nr:partial [Paramuricea clavata]